MRPNFIIIGAGRAGTTSLYHYLRQIPQVFMSPIKETNFFAFQEGVSDVEAEIRPVTGDLFPIRRREDYLALFAEAGDAVAVGEASPLYMFSPGTAQRMKDALPKARIIAVLRDPAVKLRNSNLKKPTLSPSLRDELANLYRDDVNAPQSIIGRDLVHWSSGTGA